MGPRPLCGDAATVVRPLREIIEGESPLADDGMNTGTFEPLADVREGLGRQIDAAEAGHRFRLAEAGMEAPIR